MSDTITSLRDVPQGKALADALAAIDGLDTLFTQMSEKFNTVVAAHANLKVAKPAIAATAQDEAVFDTLVRIRAGIKALQTRDVAVLALGSPSFDASGIDAAVDAFLAAQA